MLRKTRHAQRQSRPRRWGNLPVKQIGMRRRRLTDLYHFLLGASWLQALAILAAAFVSVNLIFALAYLGCGDCIENARPGSLLDAFFFSVQTSATLGYGKLVPRTVIANAIVCVEVFTGLLGLATVTGLTFAKFSRPTSRAMFSKVALISRRNGRPCLMFRMANERANRIVEAQLHVVIARDEQTAEGEMMRRSHELKLERDRSVIFALSWTVVHFITESSPLHGATPESLAAERAEIIVSMTGLDETISQTVYARHSYTAADIVPDARFVDIFSVLPDGSTQIDYRHFHDWVPIDAKQG